MTARSPSRVLLGALTVLVALSAGSACAAPDGARQSAPGTVPTPAEGGEGVPLRGPGTAPTRDDAPDPLPDPGVVPGGCVTVTYTPVTAPAPRQGELCRPAAGPRDVAVAVLHGGSGIGGTRLGMRAWAHRYLAEGYVTFLPDYHLFRPGSGERPVFPRPEQDVKAAVQYLRGVAGALGVRRDRIALQGQSAGARLGAVAFTTAGEEGLAGPGLHAGVADRVDAFVGFYHPYDGTMQYGDQYFGGDPARRALGDSLTRADRATGPAMFVTGGLDWDLIAVQQDAFAAALRGRGVEARTLVVPGGGHGFDEGGERLSRLGEQAAAGTLRFLNDVFPQEPARAAQAVDPDLASAPAGTGNPPVTVTAPTITRPAPPPSTRPRPTITTRPRPTVPRPTLRR
jgi:acetyl esterase/lipase